MNINVDYNLPLSLVAAIEAAEQRGKGAGKKGGNAVAGEGERATNRRLRAIHAGECKRLGISGVNAWNHVEGQPEGLSPEIVAILSEGELPLIVDETGAVGDMDYAVDEYDREAEVYRLAVDTPDDDWDYMASITTYRVRSRKHWRGEQYVEVENGRQLVGNAGFVPEAFKQAQEKAYRRRENHDCAFLYKGNGQLRAHVAGDIQPTIGRYSPERIKCWLAAYSPAGMASREETKEEKIARKLAALDAKRAKRNK